MHNQTFSSVNRLFKLKGLLRPFILENLVIEKNGVFNMSGGYFDYKQYQINDFAEEVKSLILNIGNRYSKKQSKNLLGYCGDNVRVSDGNKHFFIKQVYYSIDLKAHILKI